MPTGPDPATPPSRREHALLDHAPLFPGSDLAAALGFPPAGDPRWTAVADGGAESVEIKILLAPGADTAALLAGPRPARVRHRRLYLLDTDDLALARTGVHLRLRDRGRDRWDITVRLRGAGSAGEVTPVPGARVELDILPGTLFHSTQIVERVPAELAVACRDGRVAPHELLTAAQAALLAVGTGGIDGPLRAHGPLRVERASVPRPRCHLAHARHERVRFAGGRVLEEFSARCAPGEAGVVAGAAALLLAAHRLAPAARQRTKTAEWTDELLSRRRTAG
ncbi:hypothetical protein GCM10023200_10740 [Actinomycetospora chlora]|uniref:Urease accessory protein UreD n=1 Tax=Actinomycetospora chlora TaxID=663608 RepID=A0ABP9AD77_9PSEU